MNGLAVDIPEFSSEGAAGQKAAETPSGSTSTGPAIAFLDEVPQMLPADQSARVTIH